MEFQRIITENKDLKDGKSIILIFFICFFFVIQPSCKKAVDISPPSAAITQGNIYSSDATAISVLTGIYTNMSQAGGGRPFTGNNSISLFAGLSADEFTLYNGVTAANYIAYYQNSLSVVPMSGSESWGPLYNYVYNCNAAIEGLNSSQANGLTPSIKNQLIGEAKFMRAFFYFYLVNLYNDVPFALSTDPKVNSLLSRTPKEKVYKQIIQDLIEAKELLSADYLDGTLMQSTDERVRPTRWATIALLARVYLFDEDYINAEAQASEIIDNTSVFGLSSLNSVFLKNSREAIWQLQATTQFFNTEDARIFIIPATGLSDGSNPVYLNSFLLNSFEPNDNRSIDGNWVNTINVNGVDYRYPYKYKVSIQDLDINAGSGTDNIKEYIMLLRLGEQYLIRAEARANQEKISAAQSDLNAIRTRAGLANTTVNDKSSLLSIIWHERQVELFTEMGMRWFDLKRTGKIDAVMSVVTPTKSNGIAWKSYQQLYPLPLTDLQKAPNLIQNAGY